MEADDCRAREVFDDPIITIHDVNIKHVEDFFGRVIHGDICLFPTFKEKVSVLPTIVCEFRDMIQNL